MLRSGGRIGGFFSNLSLYTKGLLVVAIPVSALIASMAVFYQFEREGRTAQDLVVHTFEVRSAIREARSLLSSAEAGIRGYLLLRQQSFLESYMAAREALPAQFSRIDGLVQDNPSQVSRVPQAQRLASRVLDSMEAVRQDAAAGQKDAAIEEFAKGRVETTELRRVLDTMLSEEEALLVQRTGIEQKAQRRLEIAIFAGGVLGLLGGLIAALVFNSRIVKRVHRLEEEARQVAAGEPITGEVSGRDEIARLESTLQDTSELLRLQTSELETARGELEERVRQRTIELSQANEELHQANEIRQAIIKSAPVAIWATDLEGKVTFWNPSAEKIFGWTEGEVIGQPLPVITDEQQSEFREWLERYRTGEALAAVERKRRRNDGKLIDVSIWTAPLRDTQGNIVGAIAIDSDITEQKNLEEQFRQSQKLEAIGRLAGGVAHDFNNLLTVIMGYVEMLVSEAQDRPELVQYAQEIQYSATRASALTAQLLAFSRRQLSQPKVLDINEVVTHSTKLLRRVIGEDIEIATHLAPNLGKVKADPIHIDQLIMNLVVNARDAMSDGGKLTIETANVIVDENYVGKHLGVKPGPYTLLAISDTGTGMTEEVRNRIFEPFFTTKEAGKGTGLGLAIVYGVVKQNHGAIMVYSEPGKGTTFKIYLPMVEVPAEVAAANGSTAEPRGSETVLLCEDESAIRKLLQTMLGRLGYRILVAENPREALEMARRHNGSIDLLLTDIVMPEMSGFELARAVRGNRPHMKVLFMSGYTDNRVNNSWMLEPGTPFLHKPFTGASLAQKVREALGGGEVGTNAE